jgi:hypothetical protein
MALLSDRTLACSFRLARIVVSLTGIPSPPHQPLRRPSARAMAKRSNNSCQAGGPAREWRRKTGHALGEDAPITLLVSTPPAPEVGMNNHRRSLSG